MGIEIDELDRASPDPAAPETPVGLPGAQELYDRWEIQQWSVSRVEVVRDARRFAELRPFARRELLTALAELEIGESCVTRTLSALADHAPTEPDRIYLCTQLADEARHVQFFQRYLLQVAQVAATDLEPAGALGQASGYGQIFEPLLCEATARVREQPGEPAAWYAALVHYHLVTEGILAAAGLRTLRTMARACGLPALQEGLTNVSRDEARHLTFGLSTARDGVRSGWGGIIGETYREGVAIGARVLVNPMQRSQAPVIRQALAAYAGQICAQWSIAHGRMMRQLGLIGLESLRGELELTWGEAFAAAFTEYQEAWGTEHPVARARRLSLV
ncbi:ribonucleotide-diphosphate reductase subunit beta [Streptomyces sp. NPDC054765]